MARLVPLRTSETRNQNHRMQFGNPTALWMLLLVPAALLIAWRAALWRRRVAARLGTPSIVQRLYPGAVRTWRRGKTVATLAVFVLLSIAAARPQYGRIEQSIRREGLDVILAVDVSSSMLASDLVPHRLARAKEALRHLVGRLRGNRIGLIAFAGDAYLLCPMTEDLAIAQLVLQSIGRDSVGIDGTDLGRAIEVAEAAFERGGSGSHVLVLITDGEDNEARGLSAARKAAERMRIFAIGIGTEQGAPVPGGRQGYKAAPGGGKVVSRLEMETLIAVAEATGGAAYAAGENPTSAVSVVVDEIDRLDKVMQESRKFVIYQDRYGWFVAPAMVLIVWLLLSRPRALTHPRPVVGETEAAGVRRRA